MDKLLPCPICGSQPEIKSSDPEYLSMKYFCSNIGTHISCGDWKSTEELAVADWNKRVQKYLSEIDKPNKLTLKENMLAMQVRLIMKENGWDSEDSLSKTGWVNGFGYSIWFKRWDWHDVNIGEVCIHAHTDNLTKINKITYDTAVKCLNAWEDFTDSVPHQMADNSLKSDSIQTPFFRKALREGKKLSTEDIKKLFGKLQDTL